MRWFNRLCSGVALGYVTGAVVGLVMTSFFSDNQHDRMQEMVMTAALITGPVGVVGGLVVVAVLAVVSRQGSGR